MVTITSRNGPIRNSVLPNHMSDLANFIGIESRYVIGREGGREGGSSLLSCLLFVLLLLCRYYLKERAFHGTLVQDEEAEVSVVVC